MKKIFLAAAALLPLSFGVQAQTVLHESNPEGRMLTMKDATFGRSTYPENRSWHWDGAGTLVEGTAPSGPARYKMPVSEERGIVYGQSYSRNEFGIATGIFPSNGGALVAIVRKDERAVSEFPLLDIKSRTGSLMPIRYPMNGMASERLCLCICDTLGNVLSTIVPTEFSEERYLTGICWSPRDEYIFIQVLDRSQHHCVLNMYRSCDGSFVRTLLSEDNEAWVEPQDPLYFIKGSYEFIYRTDNRDGYRSLYLCDTLGGIRRLTSADADVAYAGNDGRYVYYTSAEVSPVQNHLFRIEIKKHKSLANVRFGAPQRLSFEKGWHNVTLSPDCSRFIDSWSSYGVPRKTAIRDVASVVKTSKARSASMDGFGSELLFEAPDPLADFAQCSMEFGTVPSADGLYENYYRLYKPLGFDPSGKYPLIVYVYGGPHSQMVTDTWRGGIRMWEMLMAQRGYVVYVQDNRGTQNRGASFEKAINRECGRVEMADQMVGVRRLMEQPWIDSSRIGVHGWSYGGFMTISLLTNYPDVFKVGVAGGPVIDWKWYEVMYGERYMDTMETNPDGFRDTSLINMVPSLRGKLLICQGALDYTVVWEHSLSFVQECIEKGVQLDFFPYPLSGHNVSGEWRIHLHQKITDYFDSWL